MMDTIGFSVVIPVYNGASFIKRAIDSCLQQTLLPKEIIVIDDGSTDHTDEEVASMYAPLVKYSRNEQNHGPSYCRNAGMRMATASWIAFLDADDIFHPDKLAIIQITLYHNPAIKALGHAFDLQGGRPVEIGEADNPTLKHFSVSEILLRNRMVTPSLVVATGNGIFFDETLNYAEDHDFILRTAEKYGVWWLDLPLCSLNRLPLSSGGQSSSRWAMRKGEMRMLTNYCKRNGLHVMIPVFVFFSLLKHIKNAVVAGS